nr:MAG TPA: hypothetical protein [Caudoviricetes sp.]
MIQNRCIVIHDLLWKVCFASILFHHGCISRNMQIIFRSKSLSIVTDNYILQFFFFHFYNW